MEKSSETPQITVFFGPSHPCMGDFEVEARYQALKGPDDPPYVYTSSWNIVHRMRVGMAEGDLRRAVYLILDPWKNQPAKHYTMNEFGGFMTPEGEPAVPESAYDFPRMSSRLVKAALRKQKEKELQ